jgi:hypothetical protein
VTSTFFPFHFIGRPRLYVIARMEEPAKLQQPNERVWSLGLVGMRAARIVSAGVAAAASIAFGLTFGFTYGVNNQTFYMLRALRLLDPSVLADDWLTAHTLDYHPAFAYLGWLLLAIGGRGGWGVGSATVVAAAGGAMCVYWLCRRILPEPIALPAFLLTLWFMLATGTRELAGTYVFDPIFQPSTVASLAFVASLPPFVSGRWLLSGILLGLAGLFHANYLILGLAVFGTAHLCMGFRDPRELGRRVIRHLGPSLVALAMLSPVILRAVGGADAARAQQILFEIRSPFHYQARNYLGDFFPFAALQALGLGFASWLFRRGDGQGRRFAAIVIATLLVVWTGSVLAVVFESRRATQLFVWRLAPYVDVLMGLVVAATASRALLTPRSPLRLSRTEIAVAVAGAAALSLSLVTRARPVVDWLEWMLAIGAAGVALRLALRWLTPLASRVPRLALQQGPRLAALVAALVFYGQVKGPLESVRARSNLVTGMPGPETDLYAWILANTGKDAVFLSPPGLERFRLASERAIVVEWKAMAYAPSETLEWYRRLEDVAGRSNPRGRDDVIAGYEALDRARLDALRERYHLSYAVVTKGHESALGYPVVYSNRAFAVLDVR